MPVIQDSYLKISIKIAMGVLVAAALAFILAAVGLYAVPNWTGRAAAGAQALARQLGVFMAGCLVGLSVLRLLLRRRKLPLYLAGGALAGLLSGLLAIAVDGSGAFTAYALIVSAVAGAAGSIPVSGAGKAGPAPVTPLSPGGQA